MAQGIRDMIYGRALGKSQQVAQEPCYFLTLSREIRDMIYGYVLINDHTIEPYPPFHEDERKPLKPQITSLLRTNKLISAEARQMLHGKNRWRIPVVDTIDSDTIFHKYPELFKHITLAFDQRDLAPAKRLDATRWAHSRLPHTRYSGRTVHNKMRREMEAIWWNARTLLCLHLPYVKTITLDLENFACPAGCCRLNLCKPNARFGFHAAILEGLDGRELERDFGEGEMVPKVYVKGLLNEQEDDLFYKELKFLEIRYDEEEVVGGGVGGYMAKKRRYHW